MQSTTPAAHDGAIRHRSMPELSDVALAIFAVIAVWFVRRSLRRRHRRD